MLLATKLAPEDGDKTFSIALAEQFLTKSGMTMQQGLDMTYPIIKMNMVNVAKIAEMDKQLC